jgi:ATP-binding cassette subfamily F protein 3
LETIDIAGDEPTALIRVPAVEPRKGPALRCRGLAIGYPERTIAKDIDLEIDHGWRAAIVGDNGQGKTTFLRTVVDSLQPLAGDVRWGYGCEIGVYAQHVYTGLPEKQSVLEYLEDKAAAGTKNQEILDLAGALLFRGEQVKKRIAVLSGGERARLCMAGLLLSSYNILVLDEPGNHLDVDTVEALATALIDYRGTVIFTSHDRHFMKRVATCIIEVRDGHVTNYRGDYESYLYSVNKEIADGERELATARFSKPPDAARNLAKGSPQANSRDVQKELKKVEKLVARLAEQKRQLNQQLMNESDPGEALRLHEEVQAVAGQLAEAEGRWCQLQEQIGESW